MNLEEQMAPWCQRCEVKLKFFAECGEHTHDVDDKTGDTYCKERDGVVWLCPECGEFHEQMGEYRRVN